MSETGLKKVNVSLPGSPNLNRSYDIHIGSGLLESCASLISPLLKRDFVAIVTDENVAKSHLEGLTQTLDRAEITHVTKIMPPGEASKSFTGLETLMQWLLDNKVERQDMVIALGGGVIGDLTGFAAATLRRGVRFTQIPTTLLAQVDSSVGGKTGINVPQGKNLVGAFHQPSLVLADLDVLQTLPDREFRAGYAEIVKYAAICDRPFFDWLEDNLEALNNRNNDALSFAIAKSCQTKADIVAQDEKEHGARALLNLGHTFAHAYENLTGYSENLLHGEAVGLGIAQAVQLSVHLGICTEADAQALVNHLAKAGLPVSQADIKGGPFKATDLVNAMAQDKKVSQGVMTFILMKAIGEAFITNEVSASQLTAFLQNQG
ncbi:MAG: 3-dehydroquinate synthase [Candidatus Micropelagos sp.]|mgnify:FL=1|nr:3-dehydroquinate synthase [Hyphomicrobiales bacterium]OUV48669.1 MAG: 3-dehydroquinate synthase [Alphaproteobacteria bacterium TMED110]